LNIIWIILFSIILVAAILSLSYYVYIYYEKPKEFIDLGTIVFLVGLIVVLVKMLWNLLNEPTLEFGDITNNNEPAYFITVKKQKGKGYAKNCEGKIKIDGINTHTVWALNEPRRIDIADEMRLRLFAVDTKKNIIDFPSAALTNGRSRTLKDLNDYLDKELTITVYCETHSPKPCRTKIRDIIANSKLE
jgi:hypothetical protein